MTLRARKSKRYLNIQINIIKVNYLRMEQAIQLATENVKNGGGPFGAVITLNGKVIATGVNKVTVDNDPTAHAEITCIRNACKELKTFNLSDCTIYSSCEPCPMCLSAIYWSRCKSIEFANTRQDAAKIGFDDAFIYEQVPLAPEDRCIPCVQVEHPKRLESFQAWEKFSSKVEY